MRKLILLPALMSALLALNACTQASEPASAPERTAPAVADPAVAMPEDAPPQEEAMAPEAGPTGTAATPAETASCLSAIGAARSARLVQRCIAVSPATHPPCNASNPCEMIQGEIDRSCAMWGPGETRPVECAA